MLFLACWNYELTSSVFANPVLFVSRPPVTKLSTIFVKVLPFTSALDCENIPGNAEVLFGPDAACCVTCGHVASHHGCIVPIMFWDEKKYFKKQRL